MRGWRWLLGISGLLILVGVGLWMLRLHLLPFLVYSVAQRYPIERLRYSTATWDAPGQVTFYTIEIEKGSWRLTIDTLRIRLFPQKVLYIKEGKVKSLESYERNETSLPTPQKLTTSLPFHRLLAWLRTVDTLYWERLWLPEALLARIEVKGDSGFLQVRRDTTCVAVRFLLHSDSVSFMVERGRLRLGKGSYAWELVEGTIHAEKRGIELEALSEGFVGFHPQLASRPLHYDTVGIWMAFWQEADSLFLRIEPRRIGLRGSLKVWGHSSGAPLYAHFSIPAQPHQAYIRAFPQGFLTCLNQAELSGESALEIYAVYDPRLPDTLALEVNWHAKDFGIRRWEGKRTPLTLREPFIYQPYGSARTIPIGPENPTFLSFYQIHPYILHAILHSEDGLFFYHQGFQKEHFLKALLENWRCRCFRRGAGTITMQLVRNLLLTREKTLARKLEEILLTAIIERFRLLSKQRMAELYVNIVEWGPEIYGLVEACRFYFGKDPHELTLPEAIFLGMLLPNPKAYRYFLDRRSGCALPAFRPHFRKIAQFLVIQNYLPADSIETIIPERVCVRPPAWSAPDTLTP